MVFEKCVNCKDHVDIDEDEFHYCIECGAVTCEECVEQIGHDCELTGF